MGPRNRTPWNLIHDQQSSLLNKQTWHHALEKSKPQINNINMFQAPFRRLLFNSGMIAKLADHLRREAINLRHAGEPTREIARMFNVSHSTISRLGTWSLRERGRC